jgi:hypothetical protein
VSVSERDRRVLHRALVDHIGEEEAGVLMDLLLPGEWGEMARRSDIEALRSDLDGLGHRLRSDIDAAVGGLRGEMERSADGLRGEMERSADGLRGELDGLGSALRLEMKVSEARLTAAFHRDMVRQTWILAGTVIAAMGAVGGLLH